MEGRCWGCVREVGPADPHPGRGGGSWDKQRFSWAFVLGRDPHWSEQLEWNVPGMKSLLLPPPLPLWNSPGPWWGERGYCSWDS